MQKDIFFIARLAACSMMVAICCSSCIIGPPARTLTLEEEMQLQRQVEHTYSLPRDQQGLAQRQVDCNQENMEKKDWASRDILLDTISDRKSKCEPFVRATQSDDVKGRDNGIDAVIDKNLKDALDKSLK